MMKQLASILCWIGFVLVTLLAVTDQIKLGSPQHLYGTIIFLLMIFVLAVGNTAKNNRDV
jgi:hypothetical protein